MPRKRDQELVSFVGRQIKAAREATGYTQQELAEIIGISTQYLSHVENGEYSVPMTLLRDICRALSVSADFIVFGEPLKKNDPTIFMEQIACLDPEYLPEILSYVESGIRLAKAAERKGAQKN